MGSDQEFISGLERDLQVNEQSELRPPPYVPGHPS